MGFNVDQLSEPLHAKSDPDTVVYEVQLGMQRTGWVIARGGTTPEQIVERLDREASRRSYGVLCADLMAGYELP